VRTRHSAHPSLVPFQAFQTKDSWIVVGCAKEKFWQRLCPIVGHPEWASDERFVDFAARDRNRDVLIPLLEDVFASRTSAEWLEALGGAAIPCGPINTVAEGLLDPHTEARGLVVEAEHPRFGSVKMPGPAVNVGPRRTDHRRAPLRNEDFDYVVRELLGYDDERISALVEEASFGDPAATPHLPG
jgi:crotonobetainyl-CoA:carnitine CoA-transferase CaiB-like acyl-CoA transferase